MSSQIVKVLETDFLTHNVKRFVVEKPAGFTFISGQATDVSINKPGLEEELRPFTFTSINTSEHLEFSIKIYHGHNGITEKLATIHAGDELIVHDVFGTITYHGPGLFIAAGAGITPFISILRQLMHDKLLYGNHLLFANRTVSDIILRDELHEMLGGNYSDVIENQGDGSDKRIIDMSMLRQYVGSVGQYYICGPDKFTFSMIGYLENLGVDKSHIIYEK